MVAVANRVENVGTTIAEGDDKQLLHVDDHYGISALSTATATTTGRQ